MLAAGEHWVSGSCKDVCGFIATFLQTSGLYFYYDCCCEDIKKNISCFSLRLHFTLLIFLLPFQGVGGYWQNMQGKQRRSPSPQILPLPNWGGTGCFNLLIRHRLGLVRSSA